jgi:chemotaxis methyl-accepting protein methylase
MPANLVEFRRLDLVTPWPVLPPLDLALCRNVLALLDPRTTRPYDRRRRKVTRNIVERISI